MKLRNTPSRNFSAADMKQLLRRQKKIDTAESNPSETDSHKGDPGVRSSNDAENGSVAPPSIKSEREISELGTGSVDDPDIISEHGGSEVTGEPTSDTLRNPGQILRIIQGQTPINSESHNSVTSTRNASFEVPTRKFQLSSGFPYHRQLFNFGVSPDEWSRFTDDVTRVTTLSTLGQLAVWGTGVTVGLTTGTFLLIFGAPPGYYAGKAVYNKAIARKVREGLEEDGELEGIMKFWNESVFAKKGCKVRLEMPYPKNGKEDPDDDTQEAKTQDESGDKKKKKKKTEKFFKLVIDPLPEGAVSGSLHAPSELDGLKQANLHEFEDNSTNRSTMYSTMPPAYAPGTFIAELESNPPASAVESSARSIREMPATPKIVPMNDGK
ncbi:hypothetical protein FQN54_006284 [Arachnomyces sp. PD_36]|nr:hypothetical protein FQN54_006284 [Arachnomyces sp. PD_36]